MDIFIECPNTGEAVRTGIEIADEETFEFLREALKEDKNRMNCSECGQEHVWGNEEAFLEN